jgi:hypothetical protein
MGAVKPTWGVHPVLKYSRDSLVCWSDGTWETMEKSRKILTMEVRRLEGCQYVRYCDICLYTHPRPHRAHAALSFVI